MPETEVSMEEYVASRAPSPIEAEKTAAITPPEKITTAPESATGQPESEKEEKSKGGGWQRRIDKLTKRGTELEESLKEEREARQRLEAKLAGRDPAELSKQKTTEPGARPKPKYTDLKADGTPRYVGNDAYDDFLEDLVDWTAEQHAAKLKNELTTEQKQAQEKTQQAQQEQTVVESFTKKSAAAKEKHADFQETVFDDDSEAQKLIAGSVIDSFILNPENEGPEVLYYLCKTPGEIDRISALSPQKQIRELGKIEDLIADQKTSSPEPKKAALPAPIKPVQGGTSKSSVKPDDMSMDDYANWRKANR